MRTTISLLTAIHIAIFAQAAYSAGAGHHDTVTYIPTVTFTLRTDIADGKLVFVGESRTIADRINPDLAVPEGAVVQISLVNGDGAVHDIAIPEFSAKSDNISVKGSATTVVFKASRSGSFEYLCTLPGHKAAGMSGRLVVGEPQSTAPDQAIEVAQDPHEVGPPTAGRAPMNVALELESTEIEGRLADGSTYRYWTFNDKVPGPFVRIRVGDTVTVSLRNAQSSTHIHSVDFHAVTGPGGGAAVTQAGPGQTRRFTFKALHPGLFVYHCATPMVAQHITNGMYGLILVEPEEGLPKVDREFYVMQGELYTAQRHGTPGLQEFSLERLLAENPSYLTFNGTVDALTRTHGMRARVGETVRIYFGVGGPNLVSSFHVIGEVFDKVYNQASLTSPPLRDVQTTLVPPGGAAIVEFKVDYPGRYILVDHALSRMEKGLVGFLTVGGDADDSIFRSNEAIDAASGH
ncbi:copper-containing nitrite reductase [Nitrosovibrio sp. Nv17]|uniref:copper-containing nitrite reductase n=1 Tax=Nitrosovibrio sp. Nv17 TaxID=1855339 RepID=UPI000908641B|nr:copper-containing nitrite reductase [Nitrosovibrio sp. Nv17]SFW16014.1 dissimilatory nitrite reductase (NO-forming), copper type apoprotein [Nitrosovibrio sp. Nv17]